MHLTPAEKLETVLHTSEPLYESYRRDLLAAKKQAFVLIYLLSPAAANM